MTTASLSTWTWWTTEALWGLSTDPEHSIWRPAEVCLSVALWVCVERPVALWQGGQATTWCGDSVKPRGELMIILSDCRSEKCQLHCTAELSIRDICRYLHNWADYCLIGQMVVYCAHFDKRFVNKVWLFSIDQYRIHFSPSWIWMLLFVVFLSHTVLCLFRFQCHEVQFFITCFNWQILDSKRTWCFWPMSCRVDVGCKK